MKHIVYIHGFNCTGKIFGYLHSNLPKHEATFADYNSSLNINVAVKQVLKNVPNDRPVYLLGHSLGGIIAFLLATRDYKIDVQKIVSISTPFGGSSIASKLKWFYPHWPIFKDLCPNSAIIREIKGATIEVPFLSIVSTSGGLPVFFEQNDGVVTVASQKAITPTHRLEIDTNHVEAVQDDDAIEEIKKFIFQ
jgi:pimeloyl-ACP methyl ester carboxylesterase